MGKMRAEWQEFKRDWPDFEKSKKVDAGAGPLMDKLEKAIEDVNKELDKLDQMVSKIHTQCDEIKKYLTPYESAVKELKKSDPSIEKDYKQALREGFYIYYGLDTEMSLSFVTRRQVNI